jgi:hypothetical protein
MAGAEDPELEQASALEAREEAGMPSTGYLVPETTQAAHPTELTTVPIPPRPPPLRKTVSTVVPGSKRAVSISQVALEEADAALQYRNYYIAKDLAYHAKLERVRRRVYPCACEATFREGFSYLKKGEESRWEGLTSEG